MPLEAGTTLGHYTITAPIGAGGMGEVYRARDAKLDRDVAIKVLPEGFAASRERLHRFEREAKSLAALNHPNIATVHGFEKDGDSHFLVMEIVQGEDLSERFSRGPLPLEEASKLFLQVAKGLEAAHKHGIVHRDLKPANAKVGDDGHVKLLDFGLAKALEEVQHDAEVSDAPTLTAGTTQAGALLGTAAYMSPEQARGKPVDKRTDIWAFGACFFEALAGKGPFRGVDAMETIGAVLRDAPDWDALPDGLPRRLRELLVRCLRKDPPDSRNRGRSDRDRRDDGRLPHRRGRAGSAFAQPAPRSVGGRGVRPRCSGRRRCRLGTPSRAAAAGAPYRRQRSAGR